MGSVQRSHARSRKLRRFLACVPQIGAHHARRVLRGSQSQAEKTRHARSRGRRDVRACPFEKDYAARRVYRKSAACWPLLPRWTAQIEVPRRKAPPLPQPPLRRRVERRAKRAAYLDIRPNIQALATEEEQAHPAARVR